jgi:hypothetical protein
MEWKWTKGEPYERSRRKYKSDENINKDGNNEVNGDYIKQIEDSAYTSSLNYDENTWDILNQSIYDGFKRESKREELDLKIADRELVQQIGFNPFLNNKNYLDDVQVRDQFLKPINTSQEKVKTTSESD